MPIKVQMCIRDRHYIEQRRIEYAKVLLASSSLSVGEIGERVGFGSGMYFSNVFRKAEGISPSAVSYTHLDVYKRQGFRHC